MSRNDKKPERAKEVSKKSVLERTIYVSQVGQEISRQEAARSEAEGQKVGGGGEEGVERERAGRRGRWDRGEEEKGKEAPINRQGGQPERDRRAHSLSLSVKGARPRVGPPGLYLYSLYRIVL